MRKAKIRSRGLVGRHEVTRREEIGPAVVMVIEKPGAKSAAPTGHTSLLRDVCERVVVIVVVEDVRAVVVRDVEVRIAVVVVVRGGDRLGEGKPVDMGRLRNVLELCAALVEEQLRRAVLV